MWLVNSQDFALSTRVGVFGRQILESGMSSFEIMIVFFFTDSFPYLFNFKKLGNYIYSWNNFYEKIFDHFMLMLLVFSQTFKSCIQ